MRRSGTRTTTNPTIERRFRYLVGNQLGGKRRQRAMRWFVFFALGLAAQDTTIRTRVNLVVVPTTVSDRAGKLVDGLDEADFLLFDNGRPQAVRMDHSDIAQMPISLVIAVQSNGMSVAALSKIRKVGSMVQPLITGERGEAAVLRFADEVELVQDFTPDGDRITKAFRQLRTAGAGARVLDALADAIERLKVRPESHRKVVLLICEARDRGSESKITESLQAAQRENITVYPLTFSNHLSPWVTRPQDAMPVVGGSGLNILGLISELAKAGTTNTGEELAQFTGGRHSSFLTSTRLEQELSRIGEELHSAYVLSFSPSGIDGAAAYRVVDVQVKGRPDLRIQARPGYWPQK
jgi:VWFA-related protein